MISRKIIGPAIIPILFSSANNRGYGGVTGEGREAEAI